MNDSAEIQRLEELVEKWAAEATRQSERADAAEARVKRLDDLNEELQVIIDNNGYPSGTDYAKLEDRVKELEDDNARGAAYVQHLKEQLAARQQGGASELAALTV